MNPIKTQFERNGYVFEQIKRVGDVAIYGQRRPGQKQPFHFEVVVICRNPSWKSFGKVFPAAEAYPSSEQWGKQGFTYTDLESAEAKLAVL